MALSMDPQIGAALARMVAGLGEPKPRPAVGDWQTRRENGNAMFGVWAALQPFPTDVVTSDFSLRTFDGKDIPLRWFHKSGTRPGSAALYVHGGGMLLGSVDVYDEILRRYVSASGVPLLAVDYRLPPEHPYPTPVEDCYAALQWLHENAAKLGIDATRVAIGGESAGGGLTAALALLARDRGRWPICFQNLVYPMLDDRTAALINRNPHTGHHLWTHDHNRFGWSALLGGTPGAAGTSPYAAPARAVDLRSLPRTLITVGQLDLFLEEDIDYATRLMQAGVPTELHVYPGAYHGFDLERDARVSRAMKRDQLEALRRVLTR